jgi:hypothetical protein
MNAESEQHKEAPLAVLLCRRAATLANNCRAMHCRLFPPREGRRLQNNFKIFIILMNIYATV